MGYGVSAKIPENLLLAPRTVPGMLALIPRIIPGSLALVLRTLPGTLALIPNTIPVTLALFRALAFHVTRVTADMMEKAKISRDYFLGSFLTSGGGRRSTPLPTQLSRLRKGGSGEKRKTDFT